MGSRISAAVPAATLSRTRTIVVTAGEATSAFFTPSGFRVRELVAQPRTVGLRLFRCHGGRGRGRTAGRLEFQLKIYRSIQRSLVTVAERLDWKVCPSTVAMIR